MTPLSFFTTETDEPSVIGWMPAAAVYFRDPDGHLLEYLAMLDEAPQARPRDRLLVGVGRPFLADTARPMSIRDAREEDLAALVEIERRGRRSSRCRRTPAERMSLR